uniref:Uncharacterized protein n=1 Tax=Alexandrium catenella TaxID=2925 RepID=A0A7S1L8V8_ALECA
MAQAREAQAPPLPLKPTAAPRLCSAMAAALAVRVLLAVIVGAAATRGLRARDGASSDDTQLSQDLARVSPKLSALLLQAQQADVDDNDEGPHETEDERSEDDEVQEVARTAQQGPLNDATHLMLASSNALLASAKAAADSA